MKKDKQDDRLQLTIIVALVFLLVILVIGVTYAAFAFNKLGTTVNSVSTGTMSMIYKEGTAGIAINNAIPITDELGKKLSADNEVFDFSIDIEVVGEQGIAYEITAVKQDGSTMKNSDVRLYLESGTAAGVYDTVAMAPSNFTPLESNDSFGAKSGEMLLEDNGTTTTKTTHYRLRMWVDKNYKLTGTAQTFSVKVSAYGKNATAAEIALLQ